MTAYYNEIDARAAAWLRELIADGLIAYGDVDERSIIDVDAKDLKGYSQHHFFAGIGGWSYALRLAGWHDDLPVWTASLPCQPFSAAGKGLGKQDERHLLPHFISLVAQCRPTVLFGEQVSAAIKHGWLDDLYAEMEANNYAVGSIVIGAHSIGAAHIRQRLYWVANSIGNDNQREVGRVNGETNRSETGDRQNVSESGKSCGAGANVRRMGNTESDDQQWDRQREACDGSQESTGRSSVLIGLADSTGERERADELRSDSRNRVKLVGSEPRCYGCDNGEIDWIYCRDNKYRPVESGTQPLVAGVPRGMVHHGNPFNTQEARTVRLKGYGNAIVPTLAAEFIKAYMQCKS